MYRGKGVWFTLLMGVMLITVSGVFFKGTESSRPFYDSAGSGVPSLSGPPVDMRSAALHIAVAMADEEFAELQIRHAAYAESRPQHVYTLERIDPGAAASEIRDRARTGVVPDIMLLPNTATIEFAAMGYLAKIEAPELEPFEPSYISPAIDAQVRWNGLTWGIPVDIDPYLLVYRSDLHPGEGDLPMDATFAEAAAWLEERNSDAVQPVTAEWLLTKQDATLFTVIGASVFRQDGQAASIAAGNEVLSGEFGEVGEWKRWDEEGIIARFTADTYKEVLEQIVEGQALLAPVPLSALQQFSQTSTLSVAALPRSRDGWTGSWQPGRSFAVSSGTLYRREALEWIQVINDASFQLAIMKQGGGIPVSSSASPLYSSASSVPSWLLSSVVQRMEVYSSAPSYYEKLTSIIRELELLYVDDSADRSRLAEALDVIQRSFAK